jgi:membrane associated rhomboid family serine protease
MPTGAISIPRDGKGGEDSGRSQRRQPERTNDVIPLRDENPSSTVPVVTRTLIVINVVMFLFEVSLGPALGPFVMHWGLVPARALAALGGGFPLAGALVPVVSSTFLHGSWMHVIGNMWYLWIFGDNVEDRMGHGRFLAFYFAAGIASGVLHTVMNPGSAVPTIGASGAIAGVLGAYLVLFPRARVLTLVPIFVFFQLMALPAVIVLGLWFVFQFFSGALAIAYTTATTGGTAWWGHIGGFALGMLLGRVLARPRARSHVWVE